MTVQDDMIAQVLDRVRQAGASGDLIVDEKESLSLKARSGQLEEQSVSRSRTLGLRVIRDGQVGIAFSEADDDTALQWLVDQALLNAHFNKTEEHERIAELSATLHTDDAVLCPQSSMTAEQRIERLLDMESTLAARPHIRNVPYNGFAERQTARTVASTHGLRATSRQRLNYLYAYALAAEGETTAMAGWGQAARRGEDVHAAPIIERAHDQATALLSGKPVASGHYAVCFDPETQSDLLSAFGLALSGKAACDGVNPWRDKLGKPVAVSGLTMVDRPLNTEGFGYALFDAEGTPTAETRLIDQGQLQTLIHNSATARELGTRSTGHATRGPKSGLGVSTHQLAILPGTADDSELLAGDYLWLTDLQGVHSGANALSGNFSFGASGYLCRDGQRLHPVRGITVAGNFYQMLQRIDAIGKQTYWTWGRSSCMPTLRFADVAISG
ncbi:MAG: TldD/PmbA family protein [Natronospirillum sp.]|uniref:TldD/PmbA family protein n=1 Tax=Natronospirillum sp. TaxID=2812955 RepID=UPI0025FAD58B|nr:TldD/PmbA family protein [Natronospirillum sp.]MCH8551475.1 TldD/PmbA family protein [Natronospirillum sp.]